jgi:hydroxymethylbilane synthase
VAQGAIGIEIRAADDATARLIAPLNHAATALCVTAERAYLAQLEGSCRTPIAGYAVLSEGALRLRGEILTPNGVHAHTATHSGSAQEAMRLGEATAADLLRQACADFFSATA